MLLLNCYAVGVLRSQYKDNDIVHHGITAKKIWENDKKRIDFLEAKGYRVYVVWDSEYKENKKEILEEINVMLNWDDELLG